MLRILLTSDAIKIETNTVVFTTALGSIFIASDVKIDVCHFFT
jgi:hypothetical protein